MNRWRWSGLGIMLMLGGCGPDGPPRYELAGKVTHAGAPIPYGQIIFAPDGAQQNGGPGSFAIIKNGDYSTFVDKGVVGGPHHVTITGYSHAPDGVRADSEIQELFPPYEATIDLPREATRHDFDIPAAPR